MNKEFQHSHQLNKELLRRGTCIEPMRNPILFFRLMPFKGI